ncbi:MAG: hypothetical protein KF779_13905 [Hyphomonadaceae bacterium]|nr:hypothetical protein [Hyphomonadaceae bacterium]
MRQSRHPTHHRVNRLNAWARLWLVWFVGFCSSFWRDDRAQAGDVARVARGIASLAVVNAMARMPAPRRTNNRHGRLNPARQRTVAGSRLRRALQGRDWRTRLMAILSVMRDLDTHATRLARRLHRGLTRLRVIDPKPDAEPAPAHFAACAIGADSS